MPFKNHSWLEPRRAFEAQQNHVKQTKSASPPPIKNFGYTFPAKHITITLAPADIKKEDWAYDPPMAVGRTLEVVAAGGHTVKLVAPLGSVKNHVGRKTADDPAGSHAIRSTRNRKNSMKFISPTMAFSSLRDELPEFRRNVLEMIGSL
jgi:Subunit ChlI of Mg-chelatase